MKGSLKRVLSFVVVSAMVLGMCQIVPLAAVQTVTVEETNCNIDNMADTPDHSTAPNSSWFRETGAGWGWLSGGIFTVDGNKMFKFSSDKIEPRNYILTKPENVTDYTMNISFKLMLDAVDSSDLVEISLVKEANVDVYGNDDQSRLVYLDNGKTGLKFTYPTGGNMWLENATFNEILTPEAEKWYTFDYKVKMVDGVTSTVDYTVTPEGGTPVTVTNAATHRAVNPDYFRISVRPYGSSASYTYLDDLAISYTYETIVEDEPTEDDSDIDYEANCDIDNMSEGTAPNDSWIIENGWGWNNGGVQTVNGNKMFKFISEKAETRTYTLTKPEGETNYTMDISFKLMLEKIDAADMVEISLVKEASSTPGNDDQSRLVYLNNGSTNLKFAYPTGGNMWLENATFNEILTPEAGKWYTFNYKVNVVDGVTSTVDYTVTPENGTPVTVKEVATHRVIDPDYFRISIQTCDSSYTGGSTYLDDLAIGYIYDKPVVDEPTEDDSNTIYEENCNIDNMAAETTPNDSWIKENGWGWLNGGVQWVNGNKMFKFQSDKAEVLTYTLMTKPENVTDYTMNVSFKLMLDKIDATDIVEISLVKEASEAVYGNDDQSRLVYLNNGSTNLKFAYPTGGNMWLENATFTDILTPEAGKWYTFDYKVKMVDGVTSTVDYTVTPENGTPVTVTDAATHRVINPDYFRISMYTDYNSGSTYLDDLAISYTVPKPEDVDDGSVTITEANTDFDKMNLSNIDNATAPSAYWTKDSGWGWLNGGIYSIDDNKMFVVNSDTTETRSYPLTLPGVSNYAMKVSFRMKFDEITTADLAEISIVEEASDNYANDKQSRLLYLGPKNATAPTAIAYPTGGDMWLDSAPTFTTLVAPQANTWYDFDYTINVVGGKTSTVDYTVSQSGTEIASATGVASHLSVVPDYFRMSFKASTDCGNKTYLDNLVIKYTYIPNPKTVESFSLIGFDNAEIEAVAAPSNGFKGFRVVLDQAYDGLTAELQAGNGAATELAATSSDDFTYDIALTGYPVAGTSYTLTVNYGETEPYVYTFTPTAESKLLIGSYSFYKADGTAVTAENTITSGETISLKAKVYNPTGDATKTACLLVSIMEDGFLKYTNLTQQAIETTFDGVEIQIQGIPATGNGTGDEAWGFLWESAEKLAPVGAKLEAAITAAQ